MNAGSQSLISQLKKFLARNFIDGVKDELDPAEAFTIQDVLDLEPCQTGEELIRLGFECVELKRPFLSIGPRGCGKSHCIEKTIERALTSRLAGAEAYLQGNREIPRDYLSEDQLVAGPGGKVQFQKALALSILPWREAPREYLDKLPERLVPLSTLWPAVPCAAKTDEFDPRRLWEDTDYAILNLDEITRFGDGFLDSLLSLLEEGKIVRRGVAYFVPIIVLATANPPGYDPTCKKLSPPLAARFARIVRVTQPDHATLIQTILPSRVRAFVARNPTFDGETMVEERMIHLIAAIGLCLWGNPDSGSPGNYFLTATTRELLRSAMKADRRLRQAMNTLGAKITFGPDARAVQDLLLFGMERARLAKRPMNADDLKAIALPILAGKVRETFNEGTQPDQTQIKEYAVREVFRRILDNPTLAHLFVPPTREAARKVFPTLAMKTAEERLVGAIHTLSYGRQDPWTRALAEFPAGKWGGAELSQWRDWATKCGALTSEGAFWSTRERQWLVALFNGDRPLPPEVSQWPADAANQWRERLLASMPLKPFARELADFGQPRANSGFAPQNELVTEILGKISATWRKCEFQLETDRAQAALVETLVGVLTAIEIEKGQHAAILWTGAAQIAAEPVAKVGYPGFNAAVELIDLAFERLAQVVNQKGRDRIRETRTILESFQALPIGPAAQNMVARDEPYARRVTGELCVAFAEAWKSRGLAPDPEQLARTGVWLGVLVGLADGDWNPDDVRSRAISTGALGGGGAFRTPDERAVIIESVLPRLLTVLGETTAQTRFHHVEALLTFLSTMPDANARGSTP